MPSAFLPGLPEDLESAAVNARALLGEIVVRLAGDGCRAKDVSDSLRLHAKLGWQVWHASFGDISALGQFAVQEKAFQTLFASLLDRGIPLEELDLLSEKLERFRAVAAQHSPDSDLLELMLDATADGKAEIRWRKQAFDANSFIFGARAKAIVAAAILFPSRNHGKFDMVRINGFRELLSTRDDVRWPISTSIVEKDEVATKPGREPLDPYSRGVPVLLKYSSAPLPKLERVQAGDTVTDLLKPGLIGLTGAVDLMTGEILREVGPVSGSFAGERAHFGVGIRTPAESLYYDHWVQRDLFPEVARELCVYGELRSETAHEETDRLRVRDTLAANGFGAKKIKIEDFPAYPQLVDEAFRRVGQRPEDFLHFRVRMKYPPMPCSVMIRHEMPMA